MPQYAKKLTAMQGAGSDKWQLHYAARAAKAQGKQIIELTIGEPDMPAPRALIDATHRAQLIGRTRYAKSQGENNLLDALCAHYQDKYHDGADMRFGVDNFLAVPGCQTGLYIAMSCFCETNDEVLVGDPLYATYDGVISSCGAKRVSVPLRAAHDFVMQPADMEKCLSPKTKAILLNYPHNPTGAVIDYDAMARICEFAIKHDLWVISDEVYEEMLYDGTCASPWQVKSARNRTVVVSSISKTFAAPGFRSGWMLGPKPIIEQLLLIGETILFGNQPFLADATVQALQLPRPWPANQMADRFRARANLIADALQDCQYIRPIMPRAGMFMLLDIAALQVPSQAFAMQLLEQHQVALMPGSSFGEYASNYLRVALVAPDDDIITAIGKIKNLADIYV